MKKNILFRTNASVSIGMGHLVRSLSLAQMLKSHFVISFLLDTQDSQIVDYVVSEEFQCHYLSEEEASKNKLKEDSYISDADIVVMDGYNFSSECQKEIKKKEKKLVCIDDIHAIHFYADAIINVSDSVSQNDYSAEPYTHFFLGSKYALLREPFLLSSRQPGRTMGCIEEVLLSMGGSDINNISLKVLKSLQKINSIKKIHVVVGTINIHERSLKDYIEDNFNFGTVILYKNVGALKLNSLICNCQLVICTASGTCLEAIAIGVGILCGSTVDNQLELLQGFVKNNCVLNMGDFNKLAMTEIENSIRLCINNIDMINSMIKNQKGLIDGLSPERFISLFSEL